MKIVPVIGVYDELLGYKNITVEQNTAVAVRGFTNSIEHILVHEMDTATVEDLTLYHLADFDMETGEFITFTPKVLCRGSSIKSAFLINQKGETDDN